jgi:transposase-like protein
MTQLSAEAKEAIVQQALTRKGKSVASIAKMNGIGGSTLHKWLRKARMGESFLTVNESAPDSKAEQLRHLIATAKLDDEALGVYCRQHGIYSHQLTQWKVNFMSDTPSVKQHSAQAELKQVKAENKRLPTVYTLYVIIW